MYDDEPEVISKSEVKRQMTALQKLGERLMELSEKQLAGLPLSNHILEQLAVAKRIKSREGLRRQMQFIGKIMRTEDGEGIAAGLEKIDNGNKALARAFHNLENWRDRLVNEGETVIDELFQELPQLDRQHLRQLIRQAKKEQENNKPPSSARKIFKHLRECFEAQNPDL